MPYSTGEFDFTFLTSVFTHILPREVQNYLKEIARVLKQGGTAFITMFIWNSEAASMLESATSRHEFKFQRAGYRIRHEKTPENAVTYEESTTRDFVAAAGLLLEKVVYGTWRSSQNAITSQDYIILRKGTRV